MKGFLKNNKEDKKEKILLLTKTLTENWKLFYTNLIDFSSFIQHIQLGIKGFSATTQKGSLACRTKQKPENEENPEEFYVSLFFSPRNINHKSNKNKRKKINTK